jgi:hypothetical protein
MLAALKTKTDTNNMNLPSFSPIWFLFVLLVCVKFNMACPLIKCVKEEQQSGIRFCGQRELKQVKFTEE